MFFNQKGNSNLLGILALDDLYNSNSKPNPISVPDSNITERTASVSNLSFPNFNLTLVSNEVNQWLLAFTVFYSLFFLFDFVFWKVLYDEGCIDNENKGAQSLEKLKKMWFSYFIYLAIFLIGFYTKNNFKAIFEGLSVVVAAIILFGIDLPMIPVLQKIVGGSKGDSTGLFSQVLNLIKFLFSQIFSLLENLTGSSAPKPDKK